jgi:glyoxylase-like metal-dependent hydrolase (beta-lactamase superfamily II)
VPSSRQDDGGRPVFSNAQYLFSRPEWEFVQAGGGDSGVITRRLRPLDALGRLDVVDSDADLRPGCSLVATPGHTPGHVSVLLRSHGRTACVLGDVCVHPAQLADTRLGYVHEVEPRLAATTRTEFLGALAEQRALVCSPHLPGSGFGHVERSEKGISWTDVVAPYADPADGEKR